jgi:hypothetical protein
VKAITTTSTGYQEMPINDLKEGIRAENTKARSMARKSLDHVRTCGEMLIAMKARVDHGVWLVELRSIGIERRTATNYMRVASEWERVSHLKRGVKDALKLLARADDPPSPAPPPAPRPSPAPVIIEAEIVEPSPAQAINSEPQEDEPETLVVDGTKDGDTDDPIDPAEPLYKAIKERVPDAQPDPIFHAIERLIYILLTKKCSAEYINALCEGVILTEAAAAESAK